MLRRIVERIALLDVSTRLRELAALDQDRPERVMRLEKLVPVVILPRHLEEPLTHLARAVRVTAHVFHVPEAPEDREEAARLVDALAELAGPEVRVLDLLRRHALDHHEDRAHVDVDVDGQYGPLPPVRQALERRQRALEVIERFSGRPGASPP